MNKYKLKKHYPGSPKCQIGTIFEYTEQLDKYFTKGGWYVERRYVENQPKFWEKVKEKDYEILSFTCKDCNKRILKHNFSKNFTGDNYYSIHSVKRLSDGEVFTVGDRIVYINCKAVRTIKSFTVKEDKLIVNANRKCDTIDYHINCISKVKQPLFTTQDGVEMFEGDTYYFVYPINSYYITDTEATKNKILAKNVFRFSTKEKAQEWVGNNKPKYSKNDVMSIIDKSLKLGLDRVFGKLYSEEYVIDLDVVKEQLNDK